MAIARGAGTEIIRSAQIGLVANTAAKLIIGVQHHIYTVLSVIMHCTARNGTEDGCLRIIGWDSFSGTTATNCVLARTAVAARETYVFNDRFSFNGFEPLAGSMSGALTTAAEQDVIADQTSAVSQVLEVYTDGASTTYDVNVTYIDQNNA